MAVSGWVKRNPLIQAWARLGFVVGGILYIVIGVLAVMIAYSNHGTAPGPQGAVERIGAQPFGHILLAVVAVGLFGYALWCFVQAFFDADHDGSDVKGVAVRFGEFCSGLAYLSLAALAFHRFQGDLAKSNSPAHWTSRILAHSGGQWLVALTGSILVLVGIGLIVYAIHERFRKYLQMGQAGASDQEWIIRFGKWGYSAQGIVFCIVGAFLISAAVHSDGGQARGLDGALEWLAQQAYGPWLLGIVAAGLGAYGLFLLVEAKYRRLT